MAVEKTCSEVMIGPKMDSETLKLEANQKGEEVVESLMRGFLVSKMAKIEEERKLKLKSLKEQALREDGSELRAEEEHSTTHRHKKHKKEKKKDKDRDRKKDKEHKRNKKSRDRSSSSERGRHRSSRSRSKERHLKKRSRSHSRSHSRDRDSRRYRGTRKQHHSRSKEQKHKKSDKKSHVRNKVQHGTKGRLDGIIFPVEDLEPILIIDEDKAWKDLDSIDEKDSANGNSTEAQAKSDRAQKLEEMEARMRKQLEEKLKAKVAAAAKEAMKTLSEAVVAPVSSASSILPPVDLSEIKLPDGKPINIKTEPLKPVAPLPAPSDTIAAPQPLINIKTEQLRPIFPLPPSIVSIPAPQPPSNIKTEQSRPIVPLPASAITTHGPQLTETTKPVAEHSKPAKAVISLANLSQIKLPAVDVQGPTLEVKPITKAKIDIKSVFSADGDDEPKRKLRKLDDDEPQGDPPKLTVITSTDEAKVISDKDNPESENKCVNPEVPLTIGTSEKDNTTEASKKAALSLGIKISSLSSEFIKSGARVDKHGRTIEDGEIVDSPDEISKKSHGSDYSDGVSEGSTRSKKKKKKHKHKKHKRKSSKDRHRDDRVQRRSRSRKRSRSLSKSRSRSRSRSRSHDRDRKKNHHAHDRSRSRSHEKRLSSRRRAPSRDKFWGDYRREWDRQRTRRRSTSPRRGKTGADLRVRIDKAKLRKIAMANALANMQSGQGPSVNLKSDEIAAIKAGGRSVEELTDFCKKIAAREKDLKAAAGVDSDVSTELSESDSEADDVGPFINHPFRLHDKNIVMNIKNAKQLPAMSQGEKIAHGLHLAFPVSSGTQHRDKEQDWVPVQKDHKDQDETATPTAVPEIPSPAAPIEGDVPEKPPPPPEDKVFPDAPSKPLNIGALVSERLSALRKLQENPNDVEALQKMYKAQKEMNSWAQGVPGQFTGSTGVKTLTPEELSGSRFQAWAKKDTFKVAPPVKAGIGMALLQKMGWKQGEGLGKNKDGEKLPLMLDVKNDRKGLFTVEEATRNKSKTVTVVTSVNKGLQGKHPVSALVELCTKRRWKSPDFILVNENGPDHQKHFQYKVRVNGWEYMPACGSANKKTAKAEAATVCLQELGLLPK